MGQKVVTKTQDSSKINVLPFGCQRITNHISRESARDGGIISIKSHIILDFLVDLLYTSCSIAKKIILFGGKGNAKANRGFNFPGGISNF